MHWYEVIIFVFLYLICALKAKAISNIHILYILFQIFTDYWKLSAQIKVDTFIGQFLNDIEFYQGKYKNLFKVVPVQDGIRKSLSLVTLYYCVHEFKVCKQYFI